MRKYEGIFVYAPNVAPDERKAQEKAFNEIVEKYDGKIADRQEMGRRSLGYEIKKHREGYFVLADIELKPGQVALFRRAVQLFPDVIKFSLTLKDERIAQIKAAKEESDKKAEKAAETAEKGA